MARNKRKELRSDEPLKIEGHGKPVTRRDFLSQGFITGSAMVMMPSLLTMATRNAIAADTALCGIDSSGGAGKVPFICFDLGGGASMTGSNVLVGGPGPEGQLDLLSQAGYAKQGLPGSMTPIADPAVVNTDLGLAFHSDSAFLRGIFSKTSIACRANVNGAVIPARSDNDTGNNPHNPMYGIAKAGAGGDLLGLIGNRNSDSGGRSMAPASMIDLTQRPTKIDRASDALGLVDTGDLGTLMPDGNEAGRVMQTIEAISQDKFLRTGSGVDKLPTTRIDPTNQNSLAVDDFVHCAYLKTTDTVTKYADPEALFNPFADTNVLNVSQPAPEFTNLNNLVDIVFPEAEATSIFNANELSNPNGSNKYERTAAVMKLVIGGMAGAGTVEFGGYDYHNGTRATGEVRDFEAGQCMGACLEYAHRMGRPVMLYVFTDGSLASNGNVDGSQNGRGKGEWTGDNSSVSAAFFLVYNPSRRPTLLDESVTPGQNANQHQQLGWMRASASVETNNSTPGANNPNLLAEMCVLNYLALHNETGRIDEVLPNHGLGDVSQLDRWIAFSQIFNGTTSSPA